MADWAAPIRVAVVEDDESFRALLVGLIGEDERFEVVGAATASATAVGLVHETRPDAVVLGLDVPLGRTMRSLPMLRHMVGIVVVVISDVPDPITLIEVLERGAAGYVDRRRVTTELLPTLAATCRALRPPPRPTGLFGAPAAPRS